jgi:hypothetical protein
VKDIAVTIIALVFIAGITACDSSIHPIANKGKAYSIYGPLDIQKTPNYIRVHDTNVLLRADETEDLDVEMTLSNLDTGEEKELSKEIVFYNGVYTHNYEIEDSITFDTRYKVEIEDGDGFKDSLISVTTREASTTVPTDSVYCNEYFKVEINEVALDKGERLEIEVAMRKGKVWEWTNKYQHYFYDSANDAFIVEWSPLEISSYLYGEPQNGTIVFPNCEEYEFKDIRVRFTHIGYMVGEELPAGFQINDTPDSFLNNQIVLSKYQKYTHNISFKDSLLPPGKREFSNPTY